MHEQWFRSDILQGIWRNFAFYFFYHDLIFYVFAVLAFNIINTVIIKYFFKKTDYVFAEEKSYFFNFKNCGDRSAFIVFAFSFCLYVINIFSLDGTIFNAYDTMIVNNINDMTYGVKPLFDSVRFNPIAGIDHNIIYAVSFNYRIVDCWNVLKQALSLFLLYKFFAFIPVAKRLSALAVINFAPSVFWVNNIIFSEQNTLIFVLLSFMSLVKYSKTKNCFTLFMFTFWLNLAIYTKETNILLYMGILAFLVLRRVFAEEIVLKSFLSPLKTLRTMPIEYLLFCNMFLFSIAYLLSSDLLTEGAYIRHNHKDISELLQINWMELIINCILFFILMFDLSKRGNWLIKGSVFGCSLISFFIVFYLQIAGYPDYYKSWYLYLPTIFCIGYIFWKLPSWGLLCLFIPFVLISGYKNYTVHNLEEGKSRHELAEFIISYPADSLILFVDKKDFKDSWKFECFNSALKYVYPDGKIIFKTNHSFRPALEGENSSFFKTIQTSAPSKGDFIIVNKTDTFDVFSENMLLVYENKFYKLYRQQ